MKYEETAQAHHTQKLLCGSGGVQHTPKPLSRLRITANVTCHTMIKRYNADEYADRK